MDRRIVGIKLLAVGAATLLWACGEKPDALLTSAKDYLDKNDPKAAIIQIKNALQQNPELAEARFLLGKALLASGDASGAAVELRKALQASYPADVAAPLLAQAMLSSGQGGKLASEFEKVELKSADAKADLQTSLAISQLSLGQVEKAKSLLGAALALKPGFPRAVLVQAELAVAARDYDQGLKLVASVLSKDAGNVDALKLKGDILSRQGDADGAIAAFRQAVERRSDFALAHSALILVLLQQGKLDEARQQMEAMKKSAPKSRSTLMAEAGYWFETKDWKKTLEVLQEVLKFVPDDPGAVLLSGLSHFQMNSLAQAEEYLSRAIKVGANTAQARRVLTVTYLRLGQPAKALETLSPLLETADEDSDLLALAGQVYMQNGQPKKAEGYFARASALDPNDMAKKTSLALTHIASGRPDAGLSELERISAADGGIKADMALIASAIRGKDYAKALKAIDVLERKKADDPLPFALRGMVLTAKGDVLAGRKNYEKALALKPSYFPAAASLAALDMRDRKPEDARRRLEGVLAADPKNVLAMLALAEISGRTGASSDVVSGQISKAIQAAPTSVMARLALINHHLSIKDAKKAVAAAQDALGSIPNEPRLLDALARAQMAAGDPNQALATLQKVEAIAPDSPQLYLRMAEVQYAVKDKDGAAKSLRRILDGRPDYLPAQQGLIKLALEAGKADEAKAILDQVKKQRPKEAVAYMIEGDIAVSRKAWSEAAAAYRAGLKVVPATEVAAKLYSSLLAAGKSAEAEKFAEGWIADHKDDAVFRLHLGDIANRQQDYPRAVRHYQAVLQRQPDNVAVLNNLAWSLGQMKDPRALDFAEKANKLAPDNAAVMDTLGALLAEKGEVGKAVSVLRKAIELAPQQPLIRLSLAKVYLKAGDKGEARKQLEELARLGERFPGQAEVSQLLKEAGG